MKRKVWIPILAAVLVVCVAAVIVLFHVLPGNPSTESTEPENVMLAEFEELLAKADQMLASGEVIIKNNHEYLLHFVNASAKYYPEAFSYTDEVFYINTAKLAIDLNPIDPEINYNLWLEQNSVRYLLLLSQIIEQYSDYIYLSGKLVDDTYSSIHVSPKLFLCTEYKEAGYESPEAFVFAKALSSDRYTAPYPFLFVIDLEQP